MFGANYFGLIYSGQSYPLPLMNNGGGGGFGANYFGLIYPGQVCPLPFSFVQNLTDTETLTEQISNYPTINKADGITLTDAITGKAIAISEADGITLTDAITGKAIAISEADGVALSDQISFLQSLSLSDIITLSDVATTTFTRRVVGGGGAWYIKNLDKMIKLDMFNRIGILELLSKPEFSKKKVAPTPAKKREPTPAQRKQAKIDARKRELQSRGTGAPDSASRMKIAVRITATFAVVIVVVGGIIVAIKRSK